MLVLMSQAKRRYPIGAELIGENQTHFRIWAPKAREVDVVFEDAAEGRPKFCPLTAEPGGYFSGAANASAGALYRFRVNGGENFYPDPASRFQPDGPHGPSCIVDPTKFRWSDAEWPGLKLKGQIIYEMHIGTFTEAGNVARRRRTIKRARPHRNHRYRNDAGRGVPGQIWLGL